MWRLKLYRGTWCAVRRHNGTTERYSLRTKDRGAAERALRDFETKPLGKLIGDIVTAYIADKKEQGARSYKSMETSWRALRPTFEQLRPDQITRLLCRSYALRRRKSGKRDGTIIKDLGVMKAALGWAKAGHLAVFDMPPTPQPRERFLTRAEFDRLLAACELQHIELFVLLALSTAARASALFELTWDRVDFEGNQIRLATGEGRRKGRATVPMTDRLRSALLTAYSARTSDYVLEWGGKPLSSVKRSFASACVAAGIEGVTPHTLRHTAAVWMVQSGIDLLKVSKYLGHTDPRVTYRVYAKFAPDFLRDAAAALE